MSEGSRKDIRVFEAYPTIEFYCFLSSNNNMKEDSKQREVSTEEAVEALTDYDVGLGRSESSHSLPKISFEGEDVREGLLWNSTEDFSKRDVDRAIERMYDFASHWAEEKGYDLEIENQTFFHRPIDEELISSVRGKIQIDDEEVDFYWKESAGILHFDYGVQDSFDASMTEEYRELYSLTENVLDEAGTITDRYPEM